MIMLSVYGMLRSIGVEVSLMEKVLPLLVGMQIPS